MEATEGARLNHAAAIPEDDAEPRRDGRAIELSGGKIQPEMVRGQ